MNHSIYSVSFLINEGMEIASCSMSNSDKDTDIKVEFYKNGIFNDISKWRKRINQMDWIKSAVYKLWWYIRRKKFCVANYSYDKKRISLLNISYL